MAEASEVEPPVAVEQPEGKEEASMEEGKEEASKEAPVEGGERKRKKRDDKPPPEVERPDRELYEEEKGELDAQIEDVKTQLDNLHIDIDIKKQDQAQMNDDMQKARSRAALARKQRDALLAEEDGMRDQMEVIEKKRAQQREYLDSLKKGLKFSKVEDLDSATAKIINKLSEGGLSIDTQSKLARSLQALRSQRDSVSGYEVQLATIRAEANATPSVRKQLEAGQAQHKACRSEEDAARKEVKVAQKAARAVSSEINKLWSSRKSIYDKKKKLMDSAYGMQREFNRNERAFERWNEYSKYLKRVQWREEKAAADKAWEEQQENGWKEEGEGEGDEEEEGEEAAKEPKKKKIPNPHAAAIAILEELVIYTTNLLPIRDNAEEVQEEESKVDVSDRNAAFKGKTVQAFSPKAVEAEEGPMYGQNNLKKKPKRRKTKKPKDDSKKSINHITDVFAKFHKVKLATPLTVGQLPATLTALTVKLEEFKAWKPMEADDEPPSHVLEAEEAHRTKARRGSVQMADAEQVRRVQEAVDQEALVVEEQSRTRRASQQMAMAMADAEQARRIAEHTHHEETNKKERATAITLVKEHAAEEQQRRVAESKPEPCTRKDNVRRASIAADAEQLRRIAAAVANPNANPAKMDAKTDAKPSTAAVAAVAPAAAVAVAVTQEEIKEVDPISQQLQAAEQDRSAGHTGPVFVDVDAGKSGAVEFKSWDDDACLGKQVPSLSSLEYLNDAFAKAQGGKPAVLLLWGQYHKPGYKFLPLYSQLQAKYGAKISIVGVSIDPSSDYATKFLKDPAKKYSTVFTTDFAVAWDKNSALKIALTATASLATMSPPHAFVVNALGKIVWHQDHSELGATAPSYMGLMEEQIDAMLAGVSLTSVGARPEEAYEEEDEEEVDIELDGDGDFMDFL